MEHVGLLHQDLLGPQCSSGHTLPQQTAGTASYWRRVRVPQPGGKSDLWTWRKRGAALRCVSTMDMHMNIWNILLTQNFWTIMYTHYWAMLLYSVRCDSIDIILFFLLSFQYWPLQCIIQWIYPPHLYAILLFVISAGPVKTLAGHVKIC